MSWIMIFFCFIWLQSTDYCQLKPPFHELRFWIIRRVGIELLHFLNKSLKLSTSNFLVLLRWNLHTLSSINTFIQKLTHNKLSIFLFTQYLFHESDLCFMDVWQIISNYHKFMMIIYTSNPDAEDNIDPLLSILSLDILLLLYLSFNTFQKMIWMMIIWLIN